MFNSLKLKIIKYKDVIIYIIFSIYIFLQLLSITSAFYGNDLVELVLKVCRYLCYAVFMLKIIIDRKDVSILECCLVFISILILAFSHNRSILITLLILMSLKSLDLDRVFRLSYRIISVTFSLIIIASILKIIPDWLYMRGDVIRHSLGFFYPTDCSSIFLLISLLLLYNNKFDTPWYQIIIFEIINILLFVYTNGRLSFLLINLILVIILLLKLNIIKKVLNKKKTFAFFKGAAFVIPIFFILITNVLIILLPSNNDTVKKIDSVLSKRITYAEQAYKKNGIGLFGKEIEWYGLAGYGYIETDDNYNYNFVDNSYARILLDYGLIFTIIIIIGYTRLLLYCCDKKNMVLYIIITIILIWSFVEPYIVNISRNIFVISFILLLRENIKASRWLHEKINQKKLHI